MRRPTPPTSATTSDGGGPADPDGFPLTFALLRGAALGVFGAGHLGGALAGGLLRANFPADRLLVCHGGSAETARRLEAEGLSERVKPAAELVRVSRIVLYCVRPQGRAAIGGLPLAADALLVSFLAGTPLAAIPVGAAPGRRVRVMPSNPETFAAGTAIAGTWPGGNPVVEELLRALQVELFPLQAEDDVHAFTALGVCLPIMFACARAFGTPYDDAGLAACAAGNGLRDFGRILSWARGVEPRFATTAEQDAYLAKAATPGGVTEAMVVRLRAGGSLPTALEAGVRRSRELSGE
jgi:pyrroline-5-carboxylate reductase